MACAVQQAGCNAFRLLEADGVHARTVGWTEGACGKQRFDLPKFSVLSGSHPSSFEDWNSRVENCVGRSPQRSPARAPHQNETPSVAVIRNEFMEGIGSHRKQVESGRESFPLDAMHQRLSLSTGTRRLESSRRNEKTFRM